MGEGAGELVQRQIQAGRTDTVMSSDHLDGDICEGIQGHSRLEELPCVFPRGQGVASATGPPPTLDL